MGLQWSSPVELSSLNNEWPVQPAFLRNDYHHTSWDCNRRWPSIEVMLPIVLLPEQSQASSSPSRNREWIDIFLRGLLLFWPIQCSRLVLTLVIDDEVRLQTPHLVDTHVTRHIAAGRRALGASFPTINVLYNKPLARLYPTGHDRQQYIMFFADQYTSQSSEYVMFCDTDVLFHSYVDRED